MTKADNLSLDMVTTKVTCIGGPTEQRDFTILHSIATKSSKFMQTTLGGDWMESHERRVSLPEIKTSDFEVYLEWLYTGYVVTLDDIEHLGTTLIRLYLLGDSLTDDQFCNTVIKTLIDNFQAADPWLDLYSAGLDSV